MPTLFVVGSFVVGLTIRTPRFPAPGENLVGDQFDFGPGGKGMNQAVACKRLGADVSLVACVGDDLFAQMALDLLAQENIPKARLHRIPGVNTGIGFVTLTPDGENTIVLHPGANMHMTRAHVRAAAEEIAGADLVMAQLETPDAAVEEAFRLARSSGAPTLLNPAPARPISPHLLPLVDILTPNESEARLLLGLPPDDPAPTEDLAPRLLALGPSTVVVTRGQAGALLITREGTTAVPAPAVWAVDVTGAGDSFNAALAVALAEGASLPQAVAYGVRAGAYAVQCLGVIDGLPTRAVLGGWATG